MERGKKPAAKSDRLPPFRALGPVIYFQEFLHYLYLLKKA